MEKVWSVLLLLAAAMLPASCGSHHQADVMYFPDARIHSHDYQEETQTRVPGHNLYWSNSLDLSASQRVNHFNRSEIMHERQQNYIQRLSEMQALDKAAQKLGREPGSLFRQ